MVICADRPRCVRSSLQVGDAFDTGRDHYGAMSEQQKSSLVGEMSRSRGTAGVLPRWIQLGGHSASTVVREAAGFVDDARTELRQLVGAVIDIGELSGQCMARVARSAVKRTDHVASELVSGGQGAVGSLVEAVARGGADVVALVSRTNDSVVATPDAA